MSYEQAYRPEIDLHSEAYACAHTFSKCTHHWLKARYPVRWEEPLVSGLAYLKC